MVSTKNIIVDKFQISHEQMNKSLILILNIIVLLIGFFDNYTKILI